MVAIQTIRQSNNGIKDLPAGQVAVFIGATSGIGEGALKQFAQLAVKPKVYVIGRRASAAAPLMEDLRQRNPAGSFEFIEKDVSLVQDTDAVCNIIKSKESRIDYLFVSAGFISFDGRQETKEGLDTSMSTRYYTRIRAIQLLLPLLNASSNPHVVSVLAGGQEAAMNEADLDLRQPQNYSFMAASIQSATMGTLVLERFAAENPRISFVHSYPGVVNTPVFTKGSSGLKLTFFSWVVAPLASLVGMTAEEAGARVLFYATSARYTVEPSEKGAVQLLPGLQKANATEKGVFLVDAKGESVGNAELLADMRNRGVDEKVWEHTLKIFEECSTKRSEN